MDYFSEVKKYSVSLMLEKNDNTEFYDEFYKSKYNKNSSDKISQNERNFAMLKQCIKRFPTIESVFQNGKEQSKDNFFHVYYKKNEIGDSVIRLYLSPKIENTPILAQRFYEKVIANFNIPLHFKIRINPTEGSKKLDQIIIYADSIDNAIMYQMSLKKIKDENPELFTGCERSPIWSKSNRNIEESFIQSNPPSDYFSTNEKCYIKSTSYGVIMERLINDGKNIIKYLDSEQSLNEAERKQIANKVFDYLYNNRYMLNSNDKKINKLKPIKVIDTSFGICLVEVLTGAGKNTIQVFTKEMKNDYMEKFLPHANSENFIKVSKNIKEISSDKYKNIDFYGDYKSMICRLIKVCSLETGQQDNK